MKYPAQLIPGDEGRFVVVFRDIPEAITQGDDKADALKEAAGALATAMEFYFEDRRPVPAPSPAEEGEEMVALPISVAAKVLLLNRMLAQRVRPSDLARMLGVTRQEVNRLTDLKHNTKIDTLAAALDALGYELSLQVQSKVLNGIDPDPSSIDAARRNDNSFALAA